MVINLRQVFDATGMQKELHYVIPVSELSEIKGYEFAEPVKIDGTVFNRAGIVTLQFTVEFTLRIICDRCLKEFEREYRYDFEHIVVKQLNTENDDYIVAESESIDLGEIAISDLLLQLPSKMLCKDDCMGLCSVCGCDLNESECDCLKK